MNSERYNNAVSVFEKVLDLTPERRLDEIERLCAGDDALERLVYDLIQRDTESSFLDTPFSPEQSRAGSRGGDEGVARIGHYRVESLLSDEGMSTVYLARQANPERRVVLKLLRHESGPRERHADGTLEREIRLLGRLQHRGIARIYDAGVGELEYTDGRTGSAWFVAMEHIEGRHLDVYTRDEGLDRDRVLALLIDICSSVEHAHQHGIIHRDLKPGNILVDEGEQPHIIDFGIATELAPSADLTESPGQIAGTVSYMAPEQFLGRLDEIDTRTDIYALGVIAYELLSGESFHLPVSSLDEALLSRLSEGNPARGPEFRKRVGREIAAVVAKASNPSRDLRYASAGAFADDLKRARDGYPVQADSAGTLRALGLAARRHSRVTMVILVAVVLTIVALAGTTFAMIGARRSAEHAENAERLAVMKALHAERIAEFLESSLYGMDPEERGSQVSLAEATDYAAERIHRDLADVPHVEADVRFSIGFVYRRHGRLNEALQQIRIAHRMCQELYGPADPRTLESAEELGYLAWLHEGDLDLSRSMLERTLGTLVENGEGSSATAGWVRIKLAVVMIASDEPSAALRLLDDAEPIMVRSYGSVYAARTMRHRALAMLLLGESARAESVASEALRLCADANEQEYIAGRCEATLGEILLRNGRLEEASDMLLGARARLVSLLPDGHPEICTLDLSIARAWLARGDEREAERYAARALDRLARSVSPDHPWLDEARAILLQIRASGLPIQERVAVLQDAHKMIEHRFGSDHAKAIDMLDLVLRATEASGDDHTSRTLRETLSTLESRRASRISFQ